MTSSPTARSLMRSIKDLGDLVIDVGFQQRQTHLAQGLPHLGLGELAVAFQLLEDGVNLSDSRSNIFSFEFRVFSFLFLTLLGHAFYTCQSTLESYLFPL